MKPIKQAKIQKLVVFVKKSWFGRNEIRLEKVLKSVSKCRISICQVEKCLYVLQIYCDLQ